MVTAGNVIGAQGSRASVDEIVIHGSSLSPAEGADHYYAIGGRLNMLPSAASTFRAAKSTFRLPPMGRPSVEAIMPHIRVKVPSASQIAR